jgi:hypothetical protein
MIRDGLGASRRRPTLFRDAFGRFDRVGLLIKLIWVVTALGVVGAIVGGSCVADVGGADGRHSGYVTAIEDLNNLVFDATIVYVKSSPQSTQEDKYCVNDPKVRADLDRFSKMRVPVTIHFKNDFFMMKWECNGGSSIIVGVEYEDGQPAEQR